MRNAVVSKALNTLFETNERISVGFAGGGVLEDAPVSIDFENVSFSYPSRPNVNVLNDVSFCIPAGSVAAFVGPSGGNDARLDVGAVTWKICNYELLQVAKARFFR